MTGVSNDDGGGDSAGATGSIVSAASAIDRSAGAAESETATPPHSVRNWHGLSSLLGDGVGTCDQKEKNDDLESVHDDCWWLGNK